MKQNMMMGDMLMSKAVEGFIAAKCEEILSKDEKCCKINEKILQIEKELLPMLSDKAKSKFLKIDELTNELINRICIITPTINLR